MIEATEREHVKGVHDILHAFFLPATLNQKAWYKVPRAQLKFGLYALKDNRTGP